MIFTERFNLEKKEADKILQPKPKSLDSEVQKKETKEKSLDKKPDTENS